ncbi:uncharacterized protein LOC143541002 [Bidens hawaiensis]|uniref:uncharacterized protein LOC143541002 n=1 Tax=Bidens hawaiensis TaxID=980011 RepID=UPI00404AB6D7
MEMDRKDWMYGRLSTGKTYINGVKGFLKAAKDNQVKVRDKMIWCPCMSCENNKRYSDITEIEYHLISHGFKPRYTCWSMHGESLTDRGMSSNKDNDDKHNLIDNDDGDLNDVNDNLNDMYNDLETNIGDSEQDKLKRLFEDSEKPLHWYGWSDASFTYLLEVVHEMLPEDNELPVSLYKAKKLMCPMGLKCKTKTDEVDEDVKNGLPAKLLWYLPIIPRLKRLLSNEKEAKLLCWHSDDRINDRKLRHVADSPQWKNIDNMYPEFGNEGPKQPGNDIDVYLSMLIDDLKTLWGTGVEVIHYQSVHGTSKVPLPCDHIYREKEKEFDGSAEHELIRKQFDAFDLVKNINTVLGKRIHGKKKTKSTTGIKAKSTRHIKAKSTVIWKKKSIFLDLPYWKDLQVRHCLDVMHIEKNVCDNLLGLLLNLPGKTKDGLKVRQDMVKMGIREELHLVPTTKGFFLPPMSNDEKKKFCKCLQDIKVPSSYSANIKRLVSLKDRKLLGMKSHDCHVLITHMIPVAIRGLLPDNIRHTITKLCLFFNTIHSKIVDPESLDALQEEIVVTLYELEMYFPPSFFDVMVHLVIHIIGEIKACGPVFLRYMYPFERYMSVLKRYVRNCHRPDVSIVEGYACEEVTEFYTGYLHGAKSIGVPQSRHSGRLEGVGGVGMKPITPGHDLLQLAYFEVLKHMTCIAPYVNEHKAALRSTYVGEKKTEMWFENNRLIRLA